MRFTNKVCIVTGAGSGIGRATALRLANEGASVAIVDRNEQGGNQTVDLITQQKGIALFIKCDVGIEDEIKHVVDTTVEKWGKVDVLVNNAATMTFKKVIDLTANEWDMVMHVNIRSVFLFCKYCLPHMNHGSVVNISSVHAHETTANVIPYATSKGAMEAFVRGASQEYASTKARFNCVAPGSVDTPMLRNNPNVKSGIEKLTGAIGKPEELAAAICFIASDEASFINGTTLVADGARLDIL
ncbi:SDR family NAD(P)-dependent oxidoreductase [Segetibacter koreensis]|uniref:SDR family NAD(P)-dependent oxidoreductase n=1 Tax=Segetibacter koreensis TaxID=398037 RepID=UPI00037461C5|nr:SDR family oxidoreductase [Segetibacter koreensis]